MLSPKEKENILLMMINALPIDGARKNIQAKVTNIKVKTPWKKQVAGVCQGLTPNLVKNLSRNRAPIKNQPCSAPQITNVQFAPCHKPLTRNTTMRLKNQRISEVLFPPNGI